MLLDTDGSVASRDADYYTGYSVTIATNVAPSKVYCACAGLYLHPESCRQCAPPANDNHVAERPRIIGLAGYGGAGKTAVANILRREHGFEGPHIKTPLRATCATLLREAGIPETMIDRYLDGDLKRETIPEFRRSGTELQQFAGTELGRDFCYPDLWLDLWLKRVDGILSAGGRVVQESVRFKNEADAIRSRGGIIVEVRRPGVAALPGGHKSEEIPTTADAIIVNDGSLLDLAAAVAKLAA